MGGLKRLPKPLRNQRTGYAQSKLERTLSIIYSAEALAAIVVHRYAIVPVIKQFKSTIAESIEAHFMRLDHVAIATAKHRPWHSTSGRRRDRIDDGRIRRVDARASLQKIA
jgi:hypothetical protein